jgi:hypothetical protein
LQHEALVRADRQQRRRAEREVRRFWSPALGRVIEATRVSTHGRNAQAEAYAAIEVAAVYGCEICGDPVDPEVIVRGPVGGGRTTCQMCPAHLRELMVPMASGGES